MGADFAARLITRANSDTFSSLLPLFCSESFELLAKTLRNEPVKKEKKKNNQKI